MLLSKCTFTEISDFSLISDFLCICFFIDMMAISWLMAVVNTGISKILD